MRRLLAIATALLACALAAPALASASSTGHASTPATPAQTPRSGSVSLELSRIARGPAAALMGVRFVAHGTLSPALRGQHVRLRIERGGRRVGSILVITGAGGRFSHGVVLGKPGAVTITAIHPASSRIARAASRPWKIAVAQPTVRARSGILFLQRRLAQLHYSVPRSGVFDSGTARAVLAFRKLTNRARTTTPSRSIFIALLRGEGTFHVRYPRDGKHVEGDLTHQVLALINPGGHVYRLYTMSSGKPSTPTVLGRFRVYRKDPGTNSEGMVDSSYFHGGYAVHGYISVPSFPASHGCLRVPVPSARAIFDWIRLGDIVDVYYR